MDSSIQLTAFIKKYKMKKIAQRTYTALFIASLTAYGDSRLLADELIDDTEAASRVITNSNDEAANEGIDADTDTQNNAQTRTTRTRSAQGIPDDGDNRRNEARDSRRNGRLAERDVVAGQEVRTYDGTSNNENRIEWGASFSNLQRIGPSNYSDGISAMVFTDRAGAREISNTIVSQGEGESIVNTYGTTDFLWQWGQFIDHDLDLTDGADEEPQPITVPTGDPYFDPDGTGASTISFHRALNDPDTGTDASNVRQQVNELTSWIDGSMIYGSSEERATALRVGPNSAFLKTSEGNLLPFNTDNLTNANGPFAEPASLFLAGDIRANEQAALSAMHIVFVREHNRIATMLSEANPDEDAETLFQIARRMVIAQVQVITYQEYLPALLGPDAVPDYTGYDSTLNPTIYNEFSAAAFRMGHSMVNDQFLRLDSTGNAIAEGPLPLMGAFFTAPQLYQSENDIDPILRGLAAQPHQMIDTRVIHTLRNMLFGDPATGGLDLISLNIQRGRDHGLPSYNSMRQAMGLTPVSSFTEISDDPELQQSLQDAYGEVSKIDLWVGALAETPLRNEGSQVGPLLRAIILKQFVDLRDGDRFWYQNDLPEEELALVENVTLADIIRNNTAIGSELQSNVFFLDQ